MRGEVESLLQHNECAGDVFLTGENTERRRSSAITSMLPDEAVASAFEPEIAGYEITRELSCGGQGVVYQAIQLSTKRKVAIKVLLAGQFASASDRKRFEREIALVAQLRHPNVVDVLEAGAAAGGQPFYVMEYVRGRTLREFAQQQRLTVRDTLSVFCAVCDGLQHAHARGVIHRDLKPSNVLVDAEGQPKILDFGLAKQLAASADNVSLTEQIVGTLPYMAPEQVRASPDAADTRTDVYALGVILYELLTGQYPYPVCGCLSDVAKNIAEVDPMSPRDAWLQGSGIPCGNSWLGRSTRCPITKDLETILLKALSKDPARRYQSAGDVGRNVERWLSGDPIDAKRDSAFYVLRVLLTRKREPMLALACVLAVSVAAALVSGYYYGLAAQSAHKLGLVQRDTADSKEDWDRRAREGLAQLGRDKIAWFLLEWENDNFEYARQIAARLPEESPEKIAAEFLLDPQMEPEDLKAEMAPGENPLRYFVIGERFRKAGRGSDARYWYKMCIDSGANDLNWIRAARGRMQNLEDPAAAVGSQTADSGRQR